MQKCYADKTLKISKEDFEKPEKLSITITCDEKTEEEGDEIKEIIPAEDTEF
jgi:penicillin-binding protein 1A